MKIIAHIDMNSYFASCEQQDNLAWRGRPLGVCEHLGGIIIAASIEAKRWGIKTGTPVWEARALYPKIVLTKTNPERYRYYTRRFLKVLADYTNDLELYSIDEAFLDISEVCNLRGRDPWQEAENIIKEIKGRITTEVGDYLKVSAGVAESKLVAKIASDMQKPDGLTVVRPEQKHLLYNKLALTDIPGISFAQERNLNQLGIKTLADLRDYPESRLIARFGVTGVHLHNAGKLEGSFFENFENRPQKSMGHMYTVEEQFRSPGNASNLLFRLSELVAKRMRLASFGGKVLFVHLHADRQQCFAASRRLGYLPPSGRALFEAASVIFSEILPKKLEEMPLYLLGLTVGGLTPSAGMVSLFQKQKREGDLGSAFDSLEEKYGEEVLGFVPAWQAREMTRDSIGFGRVKEFKREGYFKPH